jgi:hypothetical protein
MKPVNQEGVVQTAQVLLAVLNDEDGSTPNKYLEGVVSGKSLLRGIIGGQLVVCMPEKETTEKKAKEPEPEPEPDGEAAPADIE